VTLREAELRPDEMVRDAASAVAADIAWLHARRGEFVVVPCPACGAPEQRPHWRKYELDYVSCASCETVYISPRPTAEILEQFYRQSQNYAHWNRTIFPASEQARREKLFRPRATRLAEICDRLGVGRGTLLELGAGFGTFCEEVRSLDRFSRVIALEMTPDLAATCRKRGLEVIESSVEKLDPTSVQADVVASFEVIEHLFRPLDFVASIHRILTPGGILILTCPNLNGFDILELREGSIAVDHEHLNYFHPASLRVLLERAGFDLLEVQTPGKLDAELVRKQVLAGNHTLASGSFLQRVLVDDWETQGDAFQAFLAARGLSSHMWGVARKRGTEHVG
jgi:SAM-dependent methyltransferase